LDPVTHTMVGAAVAAAGWRRRTALATPVAIIAANIPDVDIVTAEAGEYASLALRRGWTHGPPAILIGALAAVGIVLLWDRIRRRRRPDGTNAGHDMWDGEDRTPRVEPRALLALSLIAALTHPVLDWMNTYGIRFLMPFDRTWYYGDSLFIIDPWLWLLLAVPLFLIHSGSRSAMIAWAALASVMTAVVVSTGFVPFAAKVVWSAALAAALVLKVALRTVGPRAIARTGIAAAALYVAAMVASSSAAERVVHSAAQNAGIEVERLMVAPRPARPLHAEIVIDDGTAYHLGDFSWLDSPRATIRPRPLPKGSFDEVARAAARHPGARDFLVWSRFPIVETSAVDDGWLVRFGDARYVDGPAASSLGGLTIRLRPDAAPEIQNVRD
jgi:inner membrane protein